MNKTTRNLIPVMMALVFSCAPNAWSADVFYDDFDGGQTLAPGVSGGFSGVTGTTPVQGYAGLGPGGNVFAGDFLINGSGGDPAPATVLALSGLPAHETINLKFLLGIIDTWDGTSFPPAPIQAPDFFSVHVDGVEIFSETFTNATGSTGQTYAPPAGVELANNVQLGFRTRNDYDFDDAYDMGLEPTFSGIPHTASSVTIEWFASGSGWGGGIGTDESWAIENVHVTVGGPRALIGVSEVSICWLSKSNRVYQVDYRSDLTTNMWFPLFTNVVGNGAMTCVYDRVTQPQRFYRVVRP